ncbi:MAG: hypothetical protein U1E65_22655 [Myxococcota bacterium]
MSTRNWSILAAPKDKPGLEAIPLPVVHAVNADQEPPTVLDPGAALGIPPAPTRPMPPPQSLSPRSVATGLVRIRPAQAAPVVCVAPSVRRAAMMRTWTLVKPPAAPRSSSALGITAGLVTALIALGYLLSG